MALLHYHSEFSKEAARVPGLPCKATAEYGKSSLGSPFTVPGTQVNFPTTLQYGNTSCTYAAFHICQVLHRVLVNTMAISSDLNLCWLSQVPESSFLRIQTTTNPFDYVFSLGHSVDSSILPGACHSYLSYSLLEEKPIDQINLLSPAALKHNSKELLSSLSPTYLLFPP